ncbi:MAG: hypothetical protein IJA34_00725 [Lachnospiraceae bacterium]|nr:hypothetical protein [Lachnospiraceae bacterium]
MKVSKHSYKLTEPEEEAIKGYLNSFVINFNIEPIILKQKDKSFLIYLSEKAEAKNEYIQYCENIHYLRGWLYGCVMTKCGRIRKKE